MMHTWQNLSSKTIWTSWKSRGISLAIKIHDCQATSSDTQWLLDWRPGPLCANTLWRRTRSSQSTSRTPVKLFQATKKAGGRPNFRPSMAKRRNKKVEQRQPLAIETTVSGFWSAGFIEIYGICQLCQSIRYTNMEQLLLNMAKTYLGPFHMYGGSAAKKKAGYIHHLNSFQTVQTM